MCGGETDRKSYLFDGDGPPAADAVGATLEAFLVLVRLVGLPRLQKTRADNKSRGV